MNEQAMITYEGKWYTVFAPLQGKSGFTHGWLADETGKIIMSFTDKYTCTDDLVKDAINYLNR